MILGIEISANTSLSASLNAYQNRLEQERDSVSGVDLNEELVNLQRYQKAYEAAPDFLADAYGIARRNYYYNLADRRVASRKYARRRDGGKGGWIRRAEEFIAPRYHFTDAQHARRTRSWD